MPMRFDSTHHMAPDTRFREVDVHVDEVVVGLLRLIEDTAGEVLLVDRDSLSLVEVHDMSAELFEARSALASQLCEAFRDDDKRAFEAAERTESWETKTLDVRTAPIGQGRATVVHADLGLRWTKGIVHHTDEMSWQWYDVLTRSRASFVVWRDPGTGRTRIYASARPMVGAVEAGEGKSVPHWLADEVDGRHEAFIITAFLDRLETMR